MAKTDFGEFHCSIARTLDAVGERWTLLILRDVFVGINRFDDLQRDLYIARNVLAERLESLVWEGILERRPYQQHPPRYEYLLTEKGRELQSVLLAIVAWGDRWTSGKGGSPVRLRHDRCGSETTAEVVCSYCGERLEAGEVTAMAGPGGRIGPGTKVIGELLAHTPRRLAGSGRPSGRPSI